MRCVYKCLYQLGIAVEEVIRRAADIAAVRARPEQPLHLLAHVFDRAVFKACVKRQVYDLFVLVADKVRIITV